MNVSAYRLVATLHAVLDELPGATGLSIHASPRWTLVLITAGSDAAVRSLSAALGLGVPEIRGAAGRWWFCALAERHQGTLRVEVIGPHHAGVSPT